MRRDPPETRCVGDTKEEDGRAPRIAASGDAACGNPVRLRGDTYLRPDLDAVWDYAGFDVAP